MTRIGFGYDVHKLIAGRKLILGGVEIPSAKGLLGHSDADVLLHAICDALLGAAALGDIGHHFPDTDERYRGISSLALLTFVGELLHAKNISINNIDSTLILQAPKIASHMPAMIHNIAEALKIDTAKISVKATTNEGLGFEGRSDGAAAHAVASLETTL